jgi:hypothetical protein
MDAGEIQLIDEWPNCPTSEVFRGQSQQVDSQMINMSIW